MCVYIYIYIYIRTSNYTTHARKHVNIQAGWLRVRTVRARDFDSRSFNLRVSDSRTIFHVNFKMPSVSSNLPGAGPIFPDLDLGNKIVITLLITMIVAMIVIKLIIVILMYHY